MGRIYITLTKHCINQIKFRNIKHSRGKSPMFFWIHVFREFILKWEYKWRKVRVSYTRDWKYRITDWVHQFIYAKPYKIEYILITYVKREWKLWNDLRPKERFIQKKS